MFETSERCLSSFCSPTACPWRRALCILRIPKVRVVKEQIFKEWGRQGKVLWMRLDQMKGSFSDLVELRVSEHCMINCHIEEIDLFSVGGEGWGDIIIFRKVIGSCISSRNKILSISKGKRIEIISLCYKRGVLVKCEEKLPNSEGSSKCEGILGKGFHLWRKKVRKTLSGTLNVIRMV